MPTSTFFRLPEEKRQRLLEAAWDEFTRTRYVNASINHIIHSAHIPRGSFYQYFVDKDDLFYYLLEEIHDHFTDVLVQLMEEAKGNLFAIPALAFDRFIQRDGATEDCFLERALHILRNNLGMDLQKLMTAKPSCMPEDILERAGTLQLQRQDPVFTRHVFNLLLMATGSAVMETLARPEQWQEQREALEYQVEIIKYGSLLPNEAAACSRQKEDTKC